jgi:hypothetical protein
MLALLLALAQQGPAPRVVLQHQLTLDRIEIGLIADGDIAPDGSVYLLDQSNRRIYRFDPRGRLLDSLGRQGKGPGEFEMAAELEVGPAGEVAIADITNRRLTIWRGDQRLEATPTISDMVLDLSWPDSGLFMVTSGWAGNGDLEIQRIAPGGGASPYATLPTEGTPPVSCTFCDGMVADGGRLFTVAPDTVFAVYQLDRSGKIMRTFTRAGFRLARWSQEELDHLESQARRRGIPWNPSSFRLKRPLQQHSIAVDGRQRLWLRPTVGSGPAILDAFAPDGRHLGTLRLGESLQGFAVRGDRMLGWGEDEDGAPVAYVYRVE